MSRIGVLFVLFAILAGCNDTHRDGSPDNGKVKVKVNAPGVNVEVEGKKNK